ncbi:MAG: hypothetical protein AAGG68_23250 [Bacteroidota bacterium]
MYQLIKSEFNLRDSKSWLRFLAYIVLEILLVLIGILLAVRIDALLEERRNNEIRCEYLEELIFVMEEDIEDMEGNISAFEEWNPKILEVALGIRDGNLEKIDSLYEKLGTVGNYINFGQGSSSKIEELKYSSINLIRDRELKTKILKYQNVDVSFLRDRERRYDKVGDDLRTYYTKNFIGFNYQDAIPNDIENLKKDTEYFSLVKQRYEWNQWFRFYYDHLLATQKEIKNDLEKMKSENCK